MLIDWKTTHCECCCSTAQQCQGRVTLQCHRGRSQSPVGDSILCFLLHSIRDNPQHHACSTLSFSLLISLYGIILDMNLTLLEVAATGTGHSPCVHALASLELHFPAGTFPSVLPLGIQWIPEGQKHGGFSALGALGCNARMVSHVSPCPQMGQLQAGLSRIASSTVLSGTILHDSF